jgi:large subunit ribosomal protein L17
MLRNLVTSLILEERIITTVEKAKYLRPFAERMVTLGKRGGEPKDVLHARRQAASFLRSPAAVKKLFDTLSPRFGERSGGYTRLTPLGFRKGDGAHIAVVEFIDAVIKKKKKKEEKGKKKEQPAPPEASSEAKKEE